MCIAVVGIDHYPHHHRLYNAVNDAHSVLEAFEQLGFARVAEPLIDGRATRAALFHLVTEELSSKLVRDDSLVLFFAGHGANRRHEIDDGPVVHNGYLLPVDADQRPHTWLELGGWLGEVAGLPARHVLVILDSCYSGVALDRDIIYRDHGAASLAGDALSRPSRRVISSARHNEQAYDDGPVPGHSLFAGCLLEAVRGRMLKQFRKPVTNGNLLGAYLQHEVHSHAHARQTPISGKLEGDAGGELSFPLGKRRRSRRSHKPVARSTEMVTPVMTKAPVTIDRPPTIDAPDPPRRVELDAIPDHCEGWTLDPAFAAALDRHDAARAQGFPALSVIAGEPMATQAAWATWAAGRGLLTLRTDARDVETAVAELLAQLPWLRCLREARIRLAGAARITADAIDAALDARSPHDRRRWIGDVAALDRHARVSGWLLSALREPAAAVPDLATAPARGGELLSIACDLACPTAVLLQHTAPDAAWLERAIGTAAVLMTHMPHRCVAVVAPGELVTAVLGRARGSAAGSMARQGLVTLATPANRRPGRGRRRTARALLDALAADPRTRGRFEIDRPIALGEGGLAIDAGLVAMRARIAIEIDGWHHFHDPEGYVRDRIQDLRLQRAGYFVLRFLAEDVDERLASTVDQIALALASRRAQGGLP